MVHRDKLKENLIWQSNTTNNLNLMRSSTIRITKASEYVDVQKISAPTAWPVPCLYMSHL